MPLSQGFYASKGMLATKRGINVLKTYGREDGIHHQQQQQQQQQHTLNKRRQLVASESMQQQQQRLNSTNKIAYNSVGANNITPNMRRSNKTAATKVNFMPATSNLPPNAGAIASNLHLYYLLGESLARYGRLQEAFDVYALIASEQSDGCVSLDRLNMLASCLINYIRQLTDKCKDDELVEDLPIIDHSNAANAGNRRLESTLKAKFAEFAHRTKNWNQSTLTAHLSKNTDKTLNEALSSLHAPTRELFGVRDSTIDALNSPMTAGVASAVASAVATSDYLDPLSCPLCCDILRNPVTTNCGHTFCRQCCEMITACNICRIKFPRSTSFGSVSATTMPVSATTVTNSTFGSSISSAEIIHTNAYVRNTTVTVTTTTVASTTATATTTMASSPDANGTNGSSSSSSSSGSLKFMPDVLVRRLVEKWWGADLQAQKINETATSYMHLNLLDDALKFCNASLEKSPTNFKSLLLRAEVLRKMNHFQSALADVDNALKSCNNSAKAHYLRALTLSQLGRFDEALYNDCLAISLDKSANLSNSELFQHDLTKILQKLLTQSPKRSRSYSSLGVVPRPYHLLSTQRLRRKLQMTLSHNYNYADTDDYMPYEKRYAIIADEDEVEMQVQMEDAEDEEGKSYNLRLRQHNSRKHFRRRWLSPSREKSLLPKAILEQNRASTDFFNILERTRQEIKRLKEADEIASNAQKHLLQVPENLVDASDFDCVLCCRTFWKPVVTPCGHTYCLVCLDRCMDYTSSCPLCMSPLVEPNVNSVYQGSCSPVPFILAKRPITKFLEAAMKRFIPDHYEKRFRQEIDMEPSVPVFICTTAFPHVPCPLFVYEPRYRLMVRRAVESGEKQFGIVQPHNGKSRYCDVGTILDIRDCVLLGDGCSILSTVGCKRFKILARNEKDGYETAKVEYIYDESIADENVKYVTNMHGTVLAKAMHWFESLSTELKQEILQSFGEMPVLEENWETVSDGPAWAWWIIALLPLSQQLKVDILATTSLEKRLRAIEKTLDYMSATFRRTQQDCSVVVVQQQPHHHHHHLQQQQQQQQHQQQQECDTNCQSDECCLRASSTLTDRDEAHSNASEHSELML